MKPSNLMLGDAEHCWVIDFGLASLRNGRSATDDEVNDEAPDALTRGGAGTPPYMAPEQFDRDAPVDARVDIWGLGVTLYEMLAWRPAFSGRSFDELREKIRGEEPTPLESHVNRLPRDLALICRKAMQKDPAQRYSSAGTFAADLRHWLAGRPTSVRRSWPRRASLWARRNPLWAAVVLLALVAGWSAVAAAASERERAEASDTAAASERERAQAANEAAASERKRAQAAERAIALHQLQSDRLSPHQAGWSDTAQDRVRKLAADSHEFDPTLNEEAFGSLFGVDAQLARVFRDISCRSVAIGPGGEVLMGGVTDAPTNRQRHNARLWDGKSPLPEELGVSGFGPVGFRDGTPIQLVADHERGTLTLMDLKGARAIHEFEVPGTLDVLDRRVKYLMPVAMTPDGGLVGARVRRADGTTALVVWSGITGKAVREFPGKVSAVAFAPDGSLVAIGGPGGDVRAWAVEGGEAVAHVRLGRAPITALAFGRSPLLSHDADDPLTPRRLWQLAAGDAGTTNAAWDLGTEAPQQRLRRTHGLTYEILILAFSGDGTLLASGSRYGANLTDIASGEALLSIATGSYPCALAFAPDGRRLVVGAEATTPDTSMNSVKSFDLEFGRGVRPLYGLASRPERIYFSAGGHLIFAISQGFEIGVWDRKTGRNLCILQAPYGIYPDNAGVAVSPDERRIAFASDRTARIWEIETGQVLQTWPDLPIGLCERLAWPEEDRLVLIRAETPDPEMPPYDRDLSDPAKFPRIVAAYNLLGPEPRTPFQVIRDYNIKVYATALTPDGTVFVLDGHEGDGGLEDRRWIAAIELVTGKTLWRHRSAKPMNHGSSLFLDPPGLLAMGLTTGRPESYTQPLIDVLTGNILEPDANYGAMGVEAAIFERGTKDGRTAIFLKGRREPILPVGGTLPLQAVSQFGTDRNAFVGGSRPPSTAIILGDLAEIQRRLQRLGLGW